MPIDISFISYFSPLLAFLIVFVVIFALLKKTKILGEHWGTAMFISFVVASLFVSAAGIRTLTLTIIPWFAVLILSLIFIWMIILFMGDAGKSLHKPIGIIFIILLALIFLISGFVVFSETISPYLPSPTFGSGEIEPNTFFLLDFLYSPRVSGAILLIAIASLATWVLTRKGN
jgi:hypothetical protein